MNRIVIRSMKIDKADGFPKLTPNKTSGLGIRRNIDIKLDKEGFVHPEVGGLSAYIPPGSNIHENFRPPKSKNAIWMLDLDVLHHRLLCYSLDSESRSHGVIQPVVSMSYSEFVDNINQTRMDWIRYDTI